MKKAIVFLSSVGFLFSINVAMSADPQRDPAMGKIAQKVVQKAAEKVIDKQINPQMATDKQEMQHREQAIRENKAKNGTSYASPAK